MSRYRNVHCLIWNDDKFPFASDDCKLVFFHLLTSPFSTGFGLYKASLGALSDEIRWPIKRYDKAFKEVLKQGFIEYDEKYFVIFIPNFLVYNPPNNPNVLRSWRHQLKELPDSYLKDEFFQSLKKICEAFREDFQKAFNEVFELACRKKVAPAPDNAPDPASVYFKEESNNKIPYEDIISDFNEKAEKKFIATKDVKKLIKERFDDGFNIDHFKRVHTTMIAKWKHDPKMEQYLRPATLYRASKFQGYLNAKISLSDQGKISPLLDKSQKVFQDFIKEGEENAK